MRLNLPDGLVKGNKVLMVGVGGGYDVWGGLPLSYTWGDKEFVYANYCRDAKVMLDASTSNTPETSLHKWLGGTIPVYCLPRVGVRAMTKCLEEIVSKHQPDTVIAVDGGVDSLMHGDEEGAGTILEDTVTLTAIHNLQVPHKILACIGFGTEMEEEVCHASALENIGQLAREGSFFGTCSLTAQMDAFKHYKEACELAWANKDGKSHIHTKVISAVLGNPNLYEGIKANVFGAKVVAPHVSALMSMYWFFDLTAVLRRNKLLPYLENTNTHTDAVVMLRQSIGSLGRRVRKALPY